VKANEKSSKIHHSVWFIFKYLTYCGYCQKAKPGWEAAARYAAGIAFCLVRKRNRLIANECRQNAACLFMCLGWSRYIKMGAYDCAGETASSSQICQDDGYPQWKIYCPLTNSTQVAFDSERRTRETTPEEILLWSIKKINKIAPECYGKSWPIRSAIK
jgi:hypothetical protein